MSKQVELFGSFKDAAGNIKTDLQVDHGKVFFNADDPQQMIVIVDCGQGTEVTYTAEHGDGLYGSLIKAGACYRDLEVA